MTGRRPKLRRILSGPSVRVIVVEHRDGAGPLGAGQLDAAPTAAGRRIVPPVRAGRAVTWGGT